MFLPCQVSLCLSSLFLFDREQIRIEKLFLLTLEIDEVSFPCPSSVGDLIDFENLKLQNEAVRSELASGQFFCDSFGFWSYAPDAPDSCKDEDGDEEYDENEEHEDTVTGDGGGDAGGTSNGGRDEENRAGYPNQATHEWSIDAEKSRRNEDTGRHPTWKAQNHQIYADGQAKCSDFHETIGGCPLSIETAKGSVIIKKEYSGPISTETGLENLSSAIADGRVDNALGNMRDAVASVTAADNAGSFTTEEASTTQTLIKE